MSQSKLDQHGVSCPSCLSGMVFIKQLTDYKRFKCENCERKWVIMD